MKKMMAIVLIGIMVLALGAMSFADAFSSPAQVYADLAGIDVAEAYELRSSGMTFGELAQEEGFYEEFAAATLEGKIVILNQLVADGTMTQEDADAIIEQLEDCDGTMTARLGQFFGTRFGQGGQGNAVRAQDGVCLNEDAPQYGLQNGSQFGSNQVRSNVEFGAGQGMGGRFGQNR